VGAGTETAGVSLDDVRCYGVVEREIAFARVGPRQDQARTAAVDAARVIDFDRNLSGLHAAGPDWIGADDDIVSLRRNAASNDRLTGSASAGSLIRTSRRAGEKRIVRSGPLDSGRPGDCIGSHVTVRASRCAYQKREADIRNGVAHEIKAGDVVVIPAGTGHWFTKIDDHINYLMIRIDPDRVTPLKSEAQSKEYLSKPAPK
jgi:hypothetical protein